MAQNESSCLPDLERIALLFKECRQEDNVILMDNYIEGYKELSKFFSLFGSIFSFVVSDVTSKLGILQHHRQSASGTSYATVQSMVQYEVNHQLLETKSSVANGCRTLLRLHRALRFISSFLHRVRTLSADQKTGGVAQEAYDQTLAKYHTWLIRKTVGLAFYTLPTRHNMLQKASTDSEEVVNGQVEEIIKHTNAVYDVVQTLYEENSLLDLP